LGEVIHQTLPSLSLRTHPAHPGNVTQQGLGSKLSPEYLYFRMKLS